MFVFAFFTSFCFAFELLKERRSAFDHRINILTDILGHRIEVFTHFFLELLKISLKGWSLFQHGVSTAEKSADQERPEKGNE